MIGRDDIENPTECNKSCKGREVPTEDELVALNAMRAIKDRVRDLKKRMDGNAESMRDLEREMTQLKAEWNEWGKKRKEAARKRMILLGHEEVS